MFTLQPVDVAVPSSQSLIKGTSSNVLSEVGNGASKFNRKMASYTLAAAGSPVRSNLMRPTTLSVSDRHRLVPQPAKL
jgi:hypothetical protein